MSTSAWHRRRMSPGAGGGLGRLAAFFTPTRVAVVLALCAGWCATYRLYYAFGGTAGMIGEPRSPAQFREINLVCGAVLLIAALVPPIMASAGGTARLQAGRGCWLARHRRLLHPHHHR